MKKIILVLFLFVFSANCFFANFLFDFSYDLKNYSNQEDYKKFNYGFSYNYNMENSSLGINLTFEDYKIFFTEQKIFLRTFKLRTGEKLFKFKVQFPVWEDSFRISYEIRGYDDSNQLIKKRNFSKVEVFEGGHNSYSYSINTLILPSMLSGSYVSVKSNDFSLNRISFKPMRFFEVPLIINYSKDLFLGFRVDNFDIFYMEGFSFGLSYYKSKIRVSSEMTFTLEIFDQRFLTSLRAIFDDDFYYEIFMINKKISLPIIFAFNNKYGGIFFEF